MNKDYALIDSCFARAREGLRVLDEASRYIVRDGDLFALFKAMRHELTNLEPWFGLSLPVRARTAHDVGFPKVVGSENARSSLWSVVRANAGRALESLRVLEEFSKMYAPRTTWRVKHMRYTLYNAELDLLKRTPNFYFYTYCDSGFVYALSESVDEIVWLVEHGAKVVQLRDKSGDTARVEEKIRRLCVWFAEFNAKARTKALLILNDYPELASRYPVAGVHVGQDVKDIDKIRKILGSNKIIGRSNQSFEQVQTSISTGVDYVSIGPVFATPTKPDRSPVGLEMLKKVVESTSVPIVAIGGINTVNAPDVRTTGVKNIAVVRSGRDFFKNSVQSV